MHRNSSLCRLVIESGSGTIRRPWRRPGHRSLTLARIASMGNGSPRSPASIAIWRWAAPRKPQASVDREDRIALDRRAHRRLDETETIGSFEPIAQRDDDARLQDVHAHLGRRAWTATCKRTGC
jgi:hypothetical protein